MRNIFIFIRRNFNVLVFLFLQAISIWALVRYNQFYRAKGLGVTNEVTGWFNSKYNHVEDFFKMKEENRRLLRMNDSLLNLLPSNFAIVDSTQKIVRDTVAYDTTNRYRQYLWRHAQVVYNTVSNEKNYIQINKGSQDGIRDNMGVFSSDGKLVGKIVNVSAHFSIAMSLLHVQNNVDVMMKRSHNPGTISWDAKDPDLLTLTRIPKSDSLVKGDTVVTGNFSLSYPPGYMVGTVEKIIQDNSTNFYVMKVKPAINFGDLQQVMIVENLQYSELNNLLDAGKKKVEETRKK